MAVPTLGSFDPERYDLWGHCLKPGCAHARPLDVVALRQRLGPTVELPAVGPLLRCERCGTKGGRITVSPRRTGGN